MRPTDDFNQGRKAGERSVSVISLLVSFLPGLLGALLGGAISWGVATQKIEDLDRRVTAVEVRAQTNSETVNQQAVYMAGQFGEIKAQLNLLLNNQR